MSDDLEISLLGQHDGPALAAYVCSRANASVFHHVEWHQAIEATYGHATSFWIARRGAAIVGAFPVVAVRYPGLGVKMVAMPYQYHSGLPLAVDDAVQRALVARALDDARARRAKYFEIRHYEPATWLTALGFQELDSGLVTTTTVLEGLTLKSLFRGHREFVGYGAKRGVVVEETNTLESLRLFRRMYLDEQRRHGSPQGGWALFNNIHHYLSGHYRLYLATKEKSCLGALLTLENEHTIFARCSATSTAEARKLHVSKALFWRALSDASGRGLRFFSFGVSSRQDKGLIAFKEGWNGTTQPVFLYVYPLTGAAPHPDKYFEGFSLAKRIWRRLPMPVVDIVGQQVTRWIC